MSQTETYTVTANQMKKLLSHVSAIVDVEISDLDTYHALSSILDEVKESKN